MTTVEQWVTRVKKTQHGFTDIKKASQEIASDYQPGEAFQLSKELLESAIPQARMLATFLLGQQAAANEEAFGLLFNTVSLDDDWRVQEILAQAFDHYCKDKGYEQALPMIRAWLNNNNPNLRRAVSEGLRIWTTRHYFKDNPKVAIELLSALKDDESEYVRKSAGNALRDISRKHADLISAELATWDKSDKRVAQVHKLAAKFI